MSYKKGLLKTINYIVEATNISPLSIMDGDNNLKEDNIENKMYIPGSSIAGAFRNYYEINNMLDEQRNDLFGGANTGMNKITFYDSHLLGNENNVSSRPGLMIDHKSMTALSFTGSKTSGSKFTREFLSEGHNFVFRFELNNYQDNLDFNKAEEEFENLLRAFNCGDIVLGRNKMIGYGRFKINKVLKEVSDFTDIKDTLLYLLKETKGIDITNKISKENYISSNITFEIEAETLTPMLIKDEEIRSNKEPDGINIVDIMGNYIVPGSSIKGALRSRAYKIKETFDIVNDDIITNIFGKESTNEDDGHISKLNCYDTQIKNPKESIYNKIKIDYFTGGTVEGALTDDEVIMGDLRIVCKLNKKQNEDLGKEIGLLVLVLRDLCIGDINIGSGYGTGRGYLKAKTLKITDDKEIIYYFDNPDPITEKLFNSYINKLIN